MRKIVFSIFLICILVCSVLVFASCCLFHDYANPIVCEPTCTQDGYTTYTCLKCNDTYIEYNKPALGHSTYVTQEGVEPTCISEGYSDELTCYVCNQIVQERTLLPLGEHTIIVTKQKVDATCMSSGLTEEQYCEVCNTLIQAQTKIDAYNYSDENADGLCDSCGLPHGRNVEYVSTVDGLKNIKNNLSGAYQLTADIDLSNVDWEPLGSESNPFKGYLYGNGYSISGLKITNKSKGGLFSYNQGMVDSLVIKNLTISASDINSTVGGIASYNKGTIKNCKIDGANTLTNSVYYYKATSWPQYDGGSVSYTSHFGGFAGVNDGVISNCLALGTFNCKYSNTAKYSLSPSILGYIPGSDELQSSSKFYFGIIAGKNNNVIQDCTVNASNINNIKVNAEKVKTYGLAIAKSYSYIGSITGYNGSQIIHCSAKRATIIDSVQNSNLTNVTAGAYGTKCELTSYVDPTYSCIVGKNEGTINDVMTI